MSKVDLDALRIDRDTAPEAPRRPLGPRLLLGAMVLLVVGVVASFLVPLLMPVRSVRTAQVRAAQGEAESTRVGVAEAAGWIEPEPFPIGVRPLVSGVLTELLVLEGDVVTKGETVIARLESATLLARLDRALAAVELRKAEVARATTESDVAQTLLEQKGAPRLVVTEVRQALVRLEKEVESMERDIDAARAVREARAADLEGQQRLMAAGGSYPVALAKARAQLREADARIAGLEVDRERIEGERKEVKARLAIAEELLLDPRGLQGEVDRRKALLEEKRAQLRVADVEARIARRELDWCDVKAPVDGVVLKLHAGPGDHVGPTGKEIVGLYEPKRLQARIDVPLANIGSVRAGQGVEIRTEAASGLVTKGIVLRVQRESDLLKNTTQVKVRLIDPDPLLVPETLCRARFLADTSSEQGGQAGPALFLVPRGAIHGGAVMVFDPGGGGTARSVAVEEVGNADGAVVVRGDLSVTHRVILDAVKAGERVQEATQ